MRHKTPDCCEAEEKRRGGLPEGSGIDRHEFEKIEDESYRLREWYVNPGLQTMAKV
jgi:hypothetical protein